MKVYAIFIAIGAVLGFFIGRAVYITPKPKQETFAQKVIQTDGSVIIERNPYENTKKIIKPTDSKLIRQAFFEIKPNNEANIKLNLSLIRLEDQTMRIIAKTDNGTIINAVDVPIDPLGRRLEAKWGLGVIYGNESQGLFIERFTDRFIFGLDVIKQNHFAINNKYAYAFRFGYKF